MSVTPPVKAEAQIVANRRTRGEAHMKLDEWLSTVFRCGGSFDDGGEFTLELTAGIEGSGEACEDLFGIHFAETTRGTL